jgi:hypothetical protein
MKYLFLLLIGMGFYSCKEAVKDVAPEIENPAENDSIFEINQSEFNQNLIINSTDDLLGYWVGWFEPLEDDYKKAKYTGEHIAYNMSNKITISIDKITGDLVEGHSVVAGNNRPFSGSINFVDGSYVFEVKEPGDDKYDGEFNFEIGKNDSVVSGKWKAYKKVETQERKYDLTKKIFNYNPNNKLANVYVDWEKKKSKMVQEEYDGHVENYLQEEYFATTEKVFNLNPSSALLTKKEVENLSKADIYVLRNSIYAKHGYSFKNRQLRAFFDKHEWYIPVHTNIKEELTEIEKNNIKLLLIYEKNAEEYYDEFGRG